MEVQNQPLSKVSKHSNPKKINYHINLIYLVGDISLLYLLNYIKLIVIVSRVIENKSGNISITYNVI